MADTGFVGSDAQNDFVRARRSQVLSRIGHRLRREPGDVDVMLPFDDVVAALGFVGERRVGLRSIALDSIAGSVDRTRDFDRRFRPTSARPRRRWERVAAQRRRGESMPPISVYRVADLHFVQDGHHRVSVARAHGQTTIDAQVTEIRTAVGADPGLRPADLGLKSHERLFYERVPIPAADRARIRLRDPWAYATLAEGVEAWGFRVMQERRELMSRAEVAAAWFSEEYEPVVAMLREAQMVVGDAETDAFQRVMADRYRLLRTHEWNADILAQVRDDLG